MRGLIAYVRMVKAGIPLPPAPKKPPVDEEMQRLWEETCAEIEAKEADRQDYLAELDREEAIREAMRIPDDAARYCRMRGPKRGGRRPRYKFVRRGCAR